MSVICAIAVCVTGLYAVDWTGSDVQAAYSEISITATNSPFVQNGKYSNIVVSPITGYEKEGANFLTEEFANNWMTFGGRSHI